MSIGARKSAQLAASQARAKMRQSQSQTDEQNALCDGARGAMCSSQDPNLCDRERDCPAFSTRIMPEPATLWNNDWDGVSPYQA